MIGNKERGIVFIFFITFLLSFSLVYSIDSADLSGLEDKVDSIPTSTDDAKQIASDYLKQEWRNTLEKSSAGRFLLAISDTLKALNPIFKNTIGIEYSLNWIFFLTLLSWIFIVNIIYQPIKEILQVNTWISLGISVVIISIGTRNGIISKSLESISKALNIWTILLSIILVLIIGYAYKIFMKKFGNSLKEKKKKEDEERREDKSKTLEKIHDIELKGSGLDT